MKTEDGGDLLLAIVDDDEIYREYLSQILVNQGNFRVISAESGGAMLKILDDNPVDCVVLDYEMGTENGLSIAGLIKKKYVDPPPIVMLTGEGKERIAVKAFRVGFSDYVSKRNLSLNELIGAIRGAVGRSLSDKTERQEQSRIARLSSFDSMTGLHASHFMHERVEALVESARRRGVKCGLIIIRLHELQGIGDELGYVMRDRALRAFAARLQKSTRETDICGRFAEDNFLYLIDRNLNAKTINSVCEQLSRDLTFEAHFDQVSFGLAPRIGAAVFPVDGESVDQLLAAAELASARAEATGVPFALASPLEANAQSTAAPDGDWAVATKPNVDVQGPPVAERRQMDRRNERRQRVLKRGQIYVRGFESVIICTIRDVSSKGARLRLEEYFAPPDQFQLLFVDNGIKRPVVLRWHIGNEVGVQILE